MAVLKNVKVKWASILEPNKTFEPVWTISCVLNDEQKKEILEQSKQVNSKGVKLKVDDDGDTIFRIQRKLYKSNGDENNPPVCKSTERDENGKLKDFDKLIGNGSVCNVQYAFYEWENKFGKGVGADLKGVQVVEHVPYGIADGEEFEDLDDSTSTKSNDEFDDEDF